MSNTERSRIHALYTVIRKTQFTRCNLLSNRLYTRFDNRLYRVNGAQKNVAAFCELWKILMDFNNFYISGNGNECHLQVSYLWPPYVIGGHYIFAL